ncbi:unnamed protein product [Ambrosiozyma monospora]|uniref:Unnamed protein product n=1 Tax=Ambrosiozyma monospora TaxID=43982 RepID=A0A9W7DL28_AMBMO|nr:unnamed protein product [Ambrosiozyma monospora]
MNLRASGVPAHYISALLEVDILPKIQREEISEFFEDVSIDLLEKITERRAKRRMAASGGYTDDASSTTETYQGSAYHTGDEGEYDEKDNPFRDPDDEEKIEALDEKDVEERLYQNMMSLRKRSGKTQEINQWIDAQQAKSESNKSESGESYDYVSDNDLKHILSSDKSDNGKRRDSQSSGTGSSVLTPSVVSDGSKGSGYYKL